VGIDDWTLRKGQRYGTVIVDLERRCILDLLPECTPGQIADWLRAHPSIEVIARDRATIYTEAIAQGAPQAIQVADRWHLTQNMSTVQQEILARHTTVLRQVAHDLTEQQRQQVPAAALISPPAVQVVLPGHIVGPVALRQEQFAEVKRLHAQGWSIRRTARRLQINRRTAMRYLAAEHVPRRVLPQTTSSAAPYLEYVRERWVQEGPQLLAELRARGYHGSLAGLYRALRPWRTGDGCRHRQQPQVPRVAWRGERQATWLLLRAPEALSAADAAYAAALCAQSPTL
jgi:transposase